MPITIEQIKKLNAEYRANIKLGIERQGMEWWFLAAKADELAKLCIQYEEDSRYWKKMYELRHIDWNKAENAWAAEVVKNQQLTSEIARLRKRYILLHQAIADIKTYADQWPVEAIKKICEQALQSNQKDSNDKK